MSSQKPRVVIDPHLHPQRPPIQTPGQVKDIRQTKEYKVAARRWVSTIVALPILLYTSYVIYERTYGNQRQRRLGAEASRPSGEGDGK